MLILRYIHFVAQTLIVYVKTRPTAMRQTLTNAEGQGIELQCKMLPLHRIS